METERICPSCRKTLAVNSPQGLCPECLMKAGFATGEAPKAGDPTGAAPFVAPPLEQLVPLFPQLEILQPLGQGGMGAVYKARQKDLDRVVALKILRPSGDKDSAFSERFTQEARALARLNHPGIVAMYEFGQAGGLPFFIMEFVDGVNLRELERAGKLSPREALQIVPQICEALQFAHDSGVVHRDIKPENILVDKKGRVKIADFGIAKIMGLEPGAAITRTQQTVGTPHYMAPEQIEKPQDVDHRADIYSLGVVFYEMLTGELPLGKFQSPSQRVQVDVRLDDVVLHALEKEPDRRYQQVNLMKTRVETISGTPPPIATPLSATANPDLFSNAQKQLRTPAIGLLIAGGFNLFLLVPGVIVLLLVPGIPLWITMLLFVPLVLSIPVVYGAFQMLRLRNFGIGILGSILAMIVVPGNLLGLPFGIWALFAMTRPEVRQSFGINPAETPGQYVPPGAGTRRSFGKAFGLGFAVLALAFLGVTGLVVAGVNGTLAHLTTEKFTEDVHTTYPIATDGRLRLENENGTVRVLAWDRPEVKLDAVKRSSTKERLEKVKIEVDAQPDHIVIRTVTPSHHGFNLAHLGESDRSVVDYTLTVPQTIRLERIEGVNGKVEIEGVHGEVNASTVNGALTAKGMTGNSSLSTVNGAIHADFASLKGVKSVTMETVNGSVDVDLPANASATVAVETVNGSVSSEFSSLEVKKEFPVGKHLTGKLGDGATEIKATTVNGAVQIHSRSN